jgi:chromosome segregation ATPase
MNEGKVLKSWDAHGGGVMAVSICNDGTMASAGRDNKVKIWDAGGNAAGEMPALVEAGHEVAITVDGKQVAAGDWAGNVRLWQRANPKDERSIPANPLPLETLLANAKSDLAKAVEERTQHQSAYDSLLKKQSDLQAELQNWQKVLETSSSSLKNLTAQHTEIKPKMEGLQQQVSNKSGELSAVKAKLTSKRQILDRAIANKQKFDEEVLVHNKQRAAAGAETSQIDVKIVEAEQQSAIQAVAIGVLNSEVTPLAADFSQREKELIELQGKLAETTKQASEVALALEQNAKRKAEAEPAIAATQQSLKQATESLEPTKQKLDAVITRIMQLEPLVAQLHMDLEAFHNRPAEINKRKLELDELLAKTNSKVKEAESGLDQAKLNLEGISAEIDKLQQQLALFQKQLSEKSTLKETSSQDLRSKQESLDGLRSQVQQLESDSASVLLQLQLFDEAYRKK